MFGFSGFQNLARQSRSRAESSKARPISPSAAPPQLPRQEELRPGRAVRRAGAGIFCGCLLPGRAWPVPYNGPAEPFWCGGYRQARTGGTHKCVPYTVPRTGRGVPGFANAARDGHGSSPTGRGGTILVRRYGQAGTGGMVGGAFGKKRTSIKISNRCDQMGVCAVFMDTGPLRKAEK